jgi:hypothetical protein
MSDEWIEVVAPCNEVEAKLLFDKWCMEHPEWKKVLQDQDIRIDTIWTQDRTTKVRYRVRPQAG